MPRLRSFLLGPVMALCLAGALVSSPAAVIITLEESGGDVVATASGSLDLSGLHFTLDAAGYNYIDPENAGIAIGDLYISMPNYNGLTASPSNFGPGGFTEPDSTSGNFFGVGPDSFTIQPFYSNGSPIVATATWNNTSFAGLGLTPGSYAWSWSADSITLNAVPEPSMATLALLALLTVVGRRNRRRL